MLKPDLRLLVQWLDPVLVSALEDRRRLKKEWHRRRKLATLETLWLMLAVSLDTHRASLYEILRLATGQLGIQWSISVPAFVGMGCACLLATRQLSPCPNHLLFGSVSVDTRASRDWGRLLSSFVAS